MKKNYIAGFITGAVIFGAIGVLASNVYNAYDNPYPIYIDGIQAQIEGYNINDKTYFQLRDIGDKIGFRVDFANDMIVVNTSPLPTATPKPTIAPPSVPLPEVPVEEVDGVKYVRKSEIEKMLDSIGLGNYEFSASYFYDAEDKSGSVLLKDIPHHPDNTTLIPIDYYLSTIVPIINSLR